MGMTTVVVINNDCFSELKKNPEGFVRLIEAGMNGENTRFSNHQVFRAHHSSESHLFFNSRGRTVDLEPWGNQTEKMLKDDRLREILKDDVEAAEQIVRRMKKRIKEVEDGK